ncbi:MAG: hypothetical protein K1000chlam2_00722 [Chlamydiae bacterium]|nr:hypothetical protein [Chlamydiota bacterium]
MIYTANFMIRGHTKKYSFLLRNASICIASVHLHAQTEEVSSVCSTATLRHIDYRGVGYDTGYTTLEGLYFPARNTNPVWPFIDLRVHGFNDNEWAANAGVGMRLNMEDSLKVYGVNGYIDYRSDHNRDFHFFQGGFGVERLGEHWEIRINGYLPITKKKSILNCDFDFPGDFFVGRNKYRGPFAGVNGELGYIARFRRFEFYGGIGPYYYAGSTCTQPMGGKLRVNMKWRRYITLEGILTHDNVFKTRAQGQIALHLPFGCDPRRGLKQSILSRPVYRNEIIVLDTFCKWETNF